MDDVTTMDATVLPARHRLDVDSFYRMAEVGIIEWGARIELIDGELIDMAPIGQDHASTVDRLTEALVLACRGRAIVRVQNPVRLGTYSEPQPDLAVLRRREDFYGTGERAGAGDVLLLIEVSDSTLRHDRAVKLPLYARAGVPECWIVNLREQVVEVHRQPTAAGYAGRTVHRAGDRLSLALDPEVTVGVDALFRRPGLTERADG